MGKARKRINKEELAEDYCFECKDGGFLVICDYKNCLKSYHPACIGRDTSNPGDDEYLKCGWHSCFICQKNASTFYCYCCPRAVCRQCIHVAEFALVRGAKGFCSNCLKLALLIEENRDVDSDGGTIDFKDRGTMEFLFMEYWVIIKEKEGLSVENLWSADALLKKNQNFKSVGDVDVIVSDEENNVHTESDCDDIEEEKPERKRKRSDAQRPHGQVCPTNKRIRTKFIGWGSRQLVEFLISLGKDTSIKLSQSEVTTLISDYICANKLIHPEKKKRVLCDARLISIFGRKSINKNKIYDHLERHFAENYEQSEDDDVRYHSDDKIKNSLVVRRSLGKSNSDRKSQVEKVILDRPKSCFASLSVKNVKLVYLKRSLVEELLKKIDTFEVKVMGAFVRVKSDPNDYTQKNSHQLVQVTGIKKSSKNVEVNTDVLLLSSIMPRGVPICMLSDDDFSEAECIDLHGKVKDGLLKRPTVVELERKAQALHEDITRHWIVRELDLLSKLFARANEKGWRAKRSEYMARKQLLETEAEQSRLLQQAPEVIADFEEVEPALLPNECLPKDGADNSGMRSIDSAAQVAGSNSNDHLAENEQANSRYAADRDVEGSVADRKHHQYLAGSISGSEENWHKLETRVHVEQPAMVKKWFSRKSCRDKLMMYQKPLAHETIPLNVDGGQEVVIDRQKNVVEVADVERLRSLFKSPTGNKKGPGKKNEVEDVEMLTWRIKSPTGNKKGPYSMALLQRWLASSSTACKYKVWKMGEREEKAIFLPEALCRIFTIK